MAGMEGQVKSKYSSAEITINLAFKGGALLVGIGIWIFIAALGEVGNKSDAIMLISQAGLLGVLFGVVFFIMGQMLRAFIDTAKTSAEILSVLKKNAEK